MAAKNYRAALVAVTCMCCLFWNAQAAQVFLAAEAEASTSTDYMALHVAAAPSFEAFVKANERAYVPGVEYEKRRALYERRSDEAMLHNANPERKWTASVNELSDWSEAELAMLRGYKGVKGSSGAQESVLAVGASTRRSVRRDDAAVLASLPEQVSYEHLESVQKIRRQGGCGSCWAVAAATILDAGHEIHQSQRGAGPRRSFSAQELVSCVPNPHECGGQGGCNGATIELAMQYVMENGVSEEQEWPYRGTTGKCSDRGQPRSLRQLSQNVSQFLKNFNLRRGRGLSAAQSSAATATAVVEKEKSAASMGMVSWEKLPENKYLPVMQALVEKGPIGISVAADAWSMYSHGIFNNCGKDAVIDHAVTLIGYGKSSTLQQKYWTIQNSWGNKWGEGGRIRLLRTDEDEKWCGTDSQPDVGSGCKGGPPQVTVCGMCGILYDTSLPVFADNAVADNAAQNIYCPKCR